MTTIKSPGGSNFPYYYKGGEIHCLKYGSYFNNETRLLAVMRAEEAFVAQPGRRLRLWVDFHESQLTDPVLAEFAASIRRLRLHIVRLAVVGCSGNDQWRLQAFGRHEGLDFRKLARFFDDPEDAKSWLVGEAY